ncbi:DUF6064 family protein [Proteiniphilum sp. UBA5384]|uniref:DUF6064 family protein n=1 Tax=Proteiniphilum sp. UBA5384 TaxID=1947279 RepID=UPI0025E7CAFD|nr:DUF6064 family protein [Proteiniphilum sp. UBA5384]
METFWRTIGAYNQGTWMFQIAILLIGITLTVGLVRKPSPLLKKAIKIYLIAIYLWIAIVYYLIYGSARSYYVVMAVYWLLMAVAWIFDLVFDSSTFERNKKYRILGYFLLFLPLLYPVFSIYRGLTFPEITSPIMPCSIVTFTIGLLLLHSHRVNIFIILLLCHWSLIGLTKTYFFDIPEDFILVGASVPALYLFFKEYFLQDLHSDTKPKAKYINILLIMSCLLICFVLIATLLSEFSYDQ